MKYSPDQFVDWSGSQGDVLQQVRDQGGNRRTLGSVEGHVTEQRVPFELLNHSHHPVVAAHAKVVALCHVVGQYHPGVLADAAEHSEQHVALQTLRLIDDDEASCSDRPRMWVSGSTSSRPRCNTSSITTLEATDPSVSKTAWAQGAIFSPSVPGK